MKSTTLLETVTVCCVLVLATDRPARADLVVTNTNRYVSAAAEVTGAGPYSAYLAGPATGTFADFAFAFAGVFIPEIVQVSTRADQDTFVPSVGASIYGNGQATAEIEFDPMASPDITAEIIDLMTQYAPTSYLRVAFTLAEPHFFSLTGSLFEQVIPSPNDDLLYAASVAQLIDRTNTITLFALEGAPGTTPFDESGILQAGDYELIVGSILGSEFPLTMTGSALAQFSVEFSVQPVPEPASIVLAGLAACGLVPCAYLRRARRSPPREKVFTL